jgi:hypothetical protein
MTSPAQTERIISMFIRFSSFSCHMPGSIARATCSSSIVNGRFAFATQVMVE